MSGDEWLLSSHYEPFPADQQFREQVGLPWNRISDCRELCSYGVLWFLLLSRSSNEILDNGMSAR